MSFLRPSPSCHTPHCSLLSPHPSLTYKCTCDCFSLPSLKAGLSSIFLSRPWQSEPCSGHGCLTFLSSSRGRPSLDPALSARASLQRGCQSSAPAATVRLSSEVWSQRAPGKKRLQLCLRDLSLLWLESSVLHPQLSGYQIRHQFESRAVAANAPAMCCEPIFRCGCVDTSLQRRSSLSFIQDPCVRPARLFLPVSFSLPASAARSVWRTDSSCLVE